MQWGEIDPYRRGRAYVGMWAWLLQRVSAVFIVLLLILHLCFTYKPYVQFLLLLAVTLDAGPGAYRRADRMVRHLYKQRTPCNLQAIRAQ